MKKTNRFIIIGLVFILYLFIGGGCVNAASASIKSNKTTVNVGDTVNITLSYTAAGTYMLIVHFQQVVQQHMHLQQKMLKMQHFQKVSHIKQKKKEHIVLIYQELYQMKVIVSHIRGKVSIKR